MGNARETAKLVSRDIIMQFDTSPHGLSTFQMERLFDIICDKLTCAIVDEHSSAALAAKSVIDNAAIEMEEDRRKSMI